MKISMCFGGGSDKDDEAAAAKNRDIERIIRADEKKAAKEVKLLLLGKTTKQPTNPNLRTHILRFYYRCWREWKVDHLEANAFDLCYGFLKERARRMARNHFQQHLASLQDYR